MAVIQHAELLLVFFDFCELAIGRWYNLATAYGFLPPYFYPEATSAAKSHPAPVWFALALVACGTAAYATGYLSLRK